MRMIKTRNGYLALVKVRVNGRRIGKVFEGRTRLGARLQATLWLSTLEHSVNRLTGVAAQ